MREQSGHISVGLTGEEPEPLEPRHVQLLVRPVSICPGLDEAGAELSPSDLCAGVEGGGKGSCRVSQFSVSQPS